MKSEKSGKNFEVVPVYVHGLKIKHLRSTEIFKGIFIAKISNRVRALLYKNKLPYGIGEDFSPNAIIVIDVEEYKSTYSEEEKRSLKNNFPEGFSAPIGQIDLAKKVLMTFFLLYGATFIFGGSFQVYARSVGDLRFGQMRGYSHSATQDSYRKFHYQLALHKSRRFSIKEVKKFNSALHMYYRFPAWRADRFSIALHSVWAALCSSYSDHAYLSLCVALEALLGSGGSQEITHQLAERGAVILANAMDDRINYYNQIKKIYSVRSKIIHGVALAKKGPITRDSLVMHAKGVVVPQADTQSIWAILCSVIIEFIRNKELWSIIRNNNNDEVVAKKINKFFLCKIMN